MSEIIRFGRFRLVPSERRLERDGQLVKIGDRALDVLLCLIANAPNLVHKTALIQQVWPDVIVEEGNLRFQIAALRRALEEGADSERCLHTVQGRGYCFVAPIIRLRELDGPRDVSLADDRCRLPTRQGGIVGRDRELSLIADRVMSHRMVTVVGPGGVGKTTVAVAAAHALLPAFDGKVCFVDLEAVTDAALVPTTLAALFGLTAHTADPIKSLVALLHDKRLLLVLDCCEHVIDVTARIAEALFFDAPHVHMLLTSREALRAEGESVMGLPPLESPPTADDIDAATALAYSATRLFVDRVAMLVEDFHLQDGDAASASEICRRLDGIPWAIELAASSVRAFGVSGELERLRDGLPLDCPGRRTAAPRHQTLSALLDWSYQLLTTAERAVLERLSTLVGAFSMETGQRIASMVSGADYDASAAIAALVSKSLLSADFSNTRNRFRLLGTTRAYALHKLRESGELQQAMRAHAEYFCKALQEADCDAEQLERSEDNIGNIRVALDWCFSPEGDLKLAAELCAGATAVFSKMSLWGECKRWTERALATLLRELVGSRLEMKLREAFGLASMFTEGTENSHRVELERSLEIAEAIGDKDYQLRVIGVLILHRLWRGEMAAAVDLAQRSAIVAGSIGTEEAVDLSDWLSGICHHLVGNQKEAMQYCQPASGRLHPKRRSNVIGYGLCDHRITARCAMARSLWLRGYHREGMEEAERTIAEAIDLQRAMTICVTLTFTGSLFIWDGDWARAEATIRDLSRHAQRYSFTPYAVMSHGLLGMLRIKQGRIAEGVEALRDSLPVQRGMALVSGAVHATALAEGLLMQGRINEGFTNIDAALRTIPRSGSAYWLPEMLRVKAALQAHSTASSAHAQATFREAIAVAERQGTLSSVLQISMSLADFHESRGATNEAWDVLASVVHRFPEGQDSLLLRAANARLEIFASSGRQARHAS